MLYPRLCANLVTTCWTDNITTM